MGEALPKSIARNGSELEIRQVFEADDFGDALPAEIREQEERLRKQMAAKQ